MLRIVLVLSLRSPGSSTMSPGRPPCAPSAGVDQAVFVQRRLDGGLNPHAHTPPHRPAAAVSPDQNVGLACDVSVVADGSAVAGEQRVDRAVPGEPLCMGQRVTAHRRPVAREHRRDRVRPLLWIVSVDQDATAAVVDRDGESPTAAATTGVRRPALPPQPNRRTPNNSAPQPGPPRGRDRPIRRGSAVAGKSPDRRCPALRRDPPARPESQGHCRTDRPPPPPERRAVAPPRAAGRRGFQRLNSTDEGDHLFVVGNAQSLPGGGTRAWRESLRSTPGCATSMRAGSA